MKFRNSFRYLRYTRRLPALGNPSTTSLIMACRRAAGSGGVTSTSAAAGVASLTLKFASLFMVDSVALAALICQTLSLHQTGRRRRGRNALLQLLDQVSQAGEEIEPQTVIYGEDLLMFELVNSTVAHAPWVSSLVRSIRNVLGPKILLDSLALASDEVRDPVRGAESVPGRIGRRGHG